MEHSGGSGASYQENDEHIILVGVRDRLYALSGMTEDSDGACPSCAP